MSRGRVGLMSNLSAHKEPPPLIGVIDPEPLARADLSCLLRGMGADVVTFESGESFLQTAKVQPTCLIVDILLPGMSGLELLRRLRSAGNTIPVILLADETDVPTAVAAMREGATDFIEKPFGDVAVLRQVRKLLGNTDDALQT